MVGKLQRWWHFCDMVIPPADVNFTEWQLLSYLDSYSFTFSWCIEHRYVGFFFTVCLRFDIHISRNLWSFATACTWYSSFSHVRAISFSFNISIELVEIAPFFFLMSEPRHGGPETNHPIVQISHQFYVTIIFSVVQCADVCYSSFSKQCVITANVWLTSGLICSMHQRSMINSF